MRDVVECVSKSGGSDYDDVRRDVVVNKQNKQKKKKRKASRPVFCLPFSFLRPQRWYKPRKTQMRPSQWIFPIHEKRPASSTASAPQLIRD